MLLHVNPLQSSKYSAEVFLGKNKDAGADPAVAKTGQGVTFQGDSDEVRLDRFQGKPTAKTWFTEQLTAFCNLRCEEENFGNLTGASILVPKVTITQVTFDEGMLRFTTDNMTVNLTWHKWFDAIESLRPSVKRIVRDARLVQELEVQVPASPTIPHILAGGSSGNFCRNTNQPLFAQMLAATTDVLSMKPLPPRIRLADAGKHLDKAVGSVILSLVNFHQTLGQHEFIKNIEHFDECDPVWKHGYPSLDSAAVLADAINMARIREAIKCALVPLDHPDMVDLTNSQHLKSLLYNVQPSGGRQVIEQLCKVRALFYALFTAQFFHLIDAHCLLNHMHIWSKNSGSFFTYRSLTSPALWLSSTPLMVRTIMGTASPSGTRPTRRGRPLSWTLASTF